MTVPQRSTPKTKCNICYSSRHRSKLVQLDDNKVAHIYHKGVEEQKQK
jgi:hypothetical protein